MLTNNNYIFPVFSYIKINIFYEIIGPKKERQLFHNAPPAPRGEQKYVFLHEHFLQVTTTAMCFSDINVLMVHQLESNSRSVTITYECLCPLAVKGTICQ